MPRSRIRFHLPPRTAKEDPLNERFSSSKRAMVIAIIDIFKDIAVLRHNVV